MAKVAQPIGLVFFVLILASFAGTEDFKTATYEQRIYCDKVASGAWPDYRGNAEAVCPPVLV